jgi:Flp pilus assembly pilin Flp
VKLIESFWEDERGQDMVEYSLLLAFVCLSGAAFFIGVGASTRTLWGIVNTRLAAANQSS